MSAHFLICVSIANELFSAQQLLDLLEVSRRHNVRTGITGMLLYQKQKFMQLTPTSATAPTSVAIALRQLALIPSSVSRPS